MSHVFEWIVKHPDATPEDVASYVRKEAGEINELLKSKMDGEGW
jgi:hypothetical protein